MARSRSKSLGQVLKGGPQVVAPRPQLHAQGDEFLTNRRLAIGGVLAIALFVAFGAGLTWLSTRDESAGSPAPVSTASSDLRGGNGPGLSNGSPAATLGAVAAPSAAAGLRTGPLANSVARREALRAVRQDLSSGLSALAERVRGCGAQSASFVLAVEAVAGAIRVESARVEERGSASEQAIACAQSALGGQSIASPTVIPGRRWDLPFSAGSL